MAIKSLIRTIPDYPKPGIMFRDITTLIGDSRGFQAAIDELVARYDGQTVDKVVAIEARGFVDTLRAVYPDPVAKPGLTWTPTTSPTDKDDHHDRIDFALAKANGLEVLSAGILGEKTPEADIVVTPWPSDHRATFAKIRF